MSYRTATRRRRRWLAQRRVRWRFLSSLLLGVVALCTLVFAAHRVAVPRNAAFLRSRAETLQSEGHYREAAHYWRLSLRMQGENEDANRQLALTLARIQDTETDFEALSRLAQALRKNPADKPVLIAYLEVTLRLGDNAEALRAARELEKAAGNEPAVYLAIAEALRRNDKTSEATKVLRHAVTANPRNLTVYQQYLAVLQRSEPQALAPAIQTMLSENNESAGALLIAYQLRRDAKLPDARATIAKALKRYPSDVEVLLMAAGEEISTDPQSAGNLLATAQTAAPNDPRVLMLRGRWLMAQGRYDEALACFESGFDSTNRTDPDFAWRIADLLIDQGEVKKLDPYLSLLLTHPSYRAVYLFLKGRLDAAAGKPQECLASLTEAQRLLDDPSQLGSFAKDASEVSYKVQLGLAAAELALGHPGRALGYAKAANRQMPMESLPLATIAAIYFQSQDYVAAARYWSDALAHPPIPPQANIELARSLLYVELEKPPSERNFRQFELARKAAERRNPDALELALLGAERKLAQGGLEEAATTLKAARQGHPSSLPVALSLCRVLVIAGQWKEAESEIAATYRQFGSSAALTLTLAQLQQRQGATEKAKKTIAASLPKWTGDTRAELLISLGNLAWSQGEQGGARDYFRKAAELSESGQMALVVFDALEDNLEKLFELVGSWEKAGDQRVSPIWPWADGILAVGRLKPDLRLARPVLRDRLATLRRIDVQSMESEEIGGLIDEIDGLKQAAIRKYWRALVRGSTGGVLPQRLVGLLLEENRIEDAEAVIATISQTRFSNPFDRCLALEVELAGGEQETALKNAAAHARQFPQSRAMQEWYARFLIQGGQTDEGIALLDQLCQQFPDQWSPWTERVRANAVATQQESSRSIESLLTEVGGKTPQFTRGMCWLEVGNRQALASALEKAAREEPLTPCDWRTTFDIARERDESLLKILGELASKAYPKASRLSAAADLR